MKRSGARYRAAVLCGLLLLPIATMADSLQQQRQRYQQAKQAWDNNNRPAVNKLLSTLTEYPLYPYLQYRILSEKLPMLSLSTVQQFVQRYPTLPPTRHLITGFINELAKRSAWSTLLQFSPQAPKAVSAQCNYYYARWMMGQTKEAWQGAAEIWQSRYSLPDSCSLLIEGWRNAGKLTEKLILERMELAFKAGNSGLVSYLLKQLPAHDQTLAAAIGSLYNRPEQVRKFAQTAAPGPANRRISLLAFQKFARQNSKSAYAALPAIARAQRMNAAQHLQLEESVAQQWCNNNVTTAQAVWRDSVITRSQNEALIERRIRFELGNGRAQLGKWLDRLPAEAQQKEEWVYWRGVVLLEKGQQQAGKKELLTLVGQRGFYPMAAAQKLKQPYAVKVNKAARPDKKLVNSAELARIQELMYWGMDDLAMSEWRNLVAHSAPAQQEALARYAFERRWADLAVQATITARMWDHLEERFPLAWQQHFNNYTRTKGVPVSYAMAVARQESGWNPLAHSSAGAVGLMQLMPRTAASITKMYGIDHYSNVSQLFDPKVNIEVGTTYLGHVYHLFDRNRIFAAIAYNAGPSRVNNWLKNSAGRVDAIAFIESIPFTETRGYVKNVLAYDLFYRYFMQQQSLQLLTNVEWGRKY